MALADSIYRNQVLEEVEKVPTEYLPSLLNIMRAFREGVTMKSAEESFRQGWQEALDGETWPIDTLWEGINAESPL